jgi:excisionase family DNA binding protein
MSADIGLSLPEKAHAALARLEEPRLGPAIPCLALRLPEAAAALAVSERTLWSWAAAGEVPCVRKGKVLLFPVDRLRQWLSELAEMAGR